MAFRYTRVSEEQRATEQVGWIYRHHPFAGIRLMKEGNWAVDIERQAFLILLDCASEAEGPHREHMFAFSIRDEVFYFYAVNHVDAHPLTPRCVWTKAAVLFPEGWFPYVPPLVHVTNVAGQDLSVDRKRDVIELLREALQAYRTATEYVHSKSFERSEFDFEQSQ